MTVARTARRRRCQAVNGYRHLALLGRGNNNRSIIRTHTAEVYQRREREKVEKQRMIAMRKGRKR